MTWQIEAASHYLVHAIWRHRGHEKYRHVLLAMVRALRNHEIGKDSAHKQSVV
jgi:hypothetical protein